MYRTVELKVSVSCTPTILKNVVDESGNIVDQQSVEPTKEELAMMDEKIKAAIACGLENLLDDADHYPGKKDHLLAWLDGRYHIDITNTEE